MRLLSKLSILILIVLITLSCRSKHGTTGTTGRLADKPLFRDTVYDGAADPSVIYNKETKSWYMFYTNRRVTEINNSIKDVRWVHGTPIGIAESKDNGASWKYIGEASINYGNDSTTFWAPEVIWNNSIYHMYLTIVPGIFTNWKHPRRIVHLTSTNLLDWKYESTLPLATDKVIDACIINIDKDNWRLWYNNEKDKKSIYYADSKDLYHWQDKGKVNLTSGKPGEGPNVFRWHDKYFMIVDEWRGLGVYSSGNALNWKRQEQRILDIPGTGKDDGVIGQHADVVINNNKAYIFYFTHPERGFPDKTPYQEARSVIQVAELQFLDGQILCERNNPVYINLSEPNN